MQGRPSLVLAMQEPDAPVTLRDTGRQRLA